MGPRPKDTPSPDKLEVVEVVRSPIWYSDGTIILQAEQTQFCVYRGLLSEHSSVFNDLLSITEGEDASEKVEGRPVIHLSDTAAEVASLLTALHDPTATLAYAGISSNNWQMISAVFRLSTKYSMASIRRAVVSCFSREIPSHDRGWEHPQNWRLLRSPVEQWELDAANICEFSHLRAVLPILLYRIATFFSAEDIFRSGILHRTNKDRIIAALSRIRRRMRESLNASFKESIPSTKCKQKTSCQVIAATYQVVWFSREIHLDAFHPFRQGSASLLPPDLEPTANEPLCSYCNSAFISAWNSCRQKTWFELPSIFSLAQSWKDLLADDAMFIVHMHGATLRVVNLPDDISDDGMNKLFSQFGRIACLKVQSYHLIGDTYGVERSALVSFTDRTAAERAMTAVHGKSLDVSGFNCVLDVRWEA